MREVRKFLIEFEDDRCYIYDELEGQCVYRNDDKDNNCEGDLDNRYARCPLVMELRDMQHPYADSPYASRIKFGKCFCEKGMP